MSGSMSVTLSTHPRRAVAAMALLIALGVSLVPGTADAQGKITRVPGKRLAKGVYTAPNDEFTLAGEGWLLPGARAEEQQIAVSTRTVTFMDDFGGMYGVIRTSDAPDSLTVEKIAHDFTVDELLRDKQIVTTRRGPELHLLGVTRGGSPVVTQTREGKNWVERKNDLYQAWSIFLDHGAIYRVTAGLTPLGHESDSVMFERTKRKLDALLGALEIHPPAP